MSERRLRHLKRVLSASFFLALLVVAVPATFATDTLDLDKAIKIGSGKIMVIEFTDPDCRFCRMAETYFQGKPQVTRYIFLLPLASHPDSKGKSQYILSAKDKPMAYQQAISSNFDKNKLAEATPAGVSLQKEHEEIARANHMNATPTFMIFGRIIEGFDLKKLEPLLR